METVHLVWAEDYSIEGGVIRVFANREAAQAFVGAHPKIKGKRVWLDDEEYLFDQSGWRAPTSEEEQELGERLMGQPEQCWQCAFWQGRAVGGGLFPLLEAVYWGPCGYAASPHYKHILDGEHPACDFAKARPISDALEKEPTLTTANVLNSIRG